MPHNLLPTIYVLPLSSLYTARRDHQSSPYRVGRNYSAPRELYQLQWAKMATKRSYTPEEIVVKLREAEVLHSQGNTIVQVCTSSSTPLNDRSFLSSQI